MKKQIPEALDGLSESIERVAISPNECDRNLEAANLVDGLFAISRSISRLAKAVEALGPAKDSEK